MPAGYGVNDTRPKETLRNIRATWKARKAELGVDDELLFVGWE